MKINKSYLKQVIMEEFSRLQEMDYATYQAQELRKKFPTISDINLAKALNQRIEKAKDMQRQKVSDQEIANNTILDPKEQDAIKTDTDPTDVDAVRALSRAKVRR